MRRILVHELATAVVRRACSYAHKYDRAHGLPPDDDDSLVRSWRRNMDFFRRVTKNRREQAHFYRDDDLSLYFVLKTKDGRQSLNGGMIFHGPHDNGGDGGAPTFSVSLSGTTKPRWEIHT